MAYTLQALIGDESVIRAAVPSDGVVVRLPQGKAMIPLSDRMLQIHGIPSLPLTDEDVIVTVVPESIAKIAEPIAMTGKVAYIEAEFYGSGGTQACVTWDTAGHASQPLQDLHAINTALRFLGVHMKDHHDEFDALGLGKHRCTEAWEVLAET